MKRAASKKNCLEKSHDVYTLVIFIIVYFVQPKTKNLSGIIIYGWKVRCVISDESGNTVTSTAVTIEIR